MLKMNQSYKYKHWEDLIVPFLLGVEYCDTTVFVGYMVKTTSKFYYYYFLLVVKIPWQVSWTQEYPKFAARLEIVQKNIRCLNSSYALFIFKKLCLSICYLDYFTILLFREKEIIQEVMLN